MTVRSSNSASAFWRPRFPMPDRRSGSAASSAMARAERGAVVDGHEQPGHVVVHHLTAPPDVGGDHRHAAGRRLHGRAGEPLAVGRERIHVEPGVEILDVVPVAREHDVAESTRLGDVFWFERVPLIGVLGSHDDEGDVVPERPQVTGHGEQLAEPLLPDETSDGTDDDRRVVHAQGPPGARRRLRRPDAVEALEVDAVAQQHQAPGRDAEPAHDLEVLGVLEELHVGAHGGDPLEGVHDRLPQQRVLGCRVEAVHGVDDAGHSCRSGRDPPVQAGLGVVGVDDVRPEFPEQALELDQGQDVLSDGDGPCGMFQWHVGDAPGGELVDEGTRRGHADDLHAGVGERPQLRAEEEGQADVRRGDVDEATAREVAHRPAPASLR